MHKQIASQNYCGPQSGKMKAPVCGSQRFNWSSFFSILATQPLIGDDIVLSGHHAAITPITTFRKNTQYRNLLTCINVQAIVQSSFELDDIKQQYPTRDTRCEHHTHRLTRTVKQTCLARTTLPRKQKLYTKCYRTIDVNNDIRMRMDELTGAAYRIT